MKKVAVFVYSLGGGGAEKAVLEIANGLKSDFEISVVTLSPTQNYDTLGLNVVSLYKHDLKSSSFDKLLSIFKVAFSFAAYCKQNKIDVVISCLSRPNIIAAAAKCIYPRFRLIAAEHTTLSNYYGNSFAEKILKTALALAYKMANVVIAVSSGIKEDLSQNFGVKNKKITVVYNPVDIEKIKLLSLHKAPRQADEEFVFVTAGRLVESKNYPFLFEAFKLLPSGARLWVLGSGEMESELKFLAVEMGIHERVKFFGFCENPYSYFASADCFVMSSRLEGLPTVQIEALACGLPVVSTDCKSGPREILKGGKEMLVNGLEGAEYGIIVGLESSRFLSIAMQKMMENDEMRAAYRQKAPIRASEFSKEHSLAIYKQLIEGK